MIRSSRDLASISVFVGVIAALGLVPPLFLLGGAVPITAQSMGVMLAGAILGARRGALSMLVFVLLVAAGLPLLSGGVGGLAVFATPRVGFLLGFPLAAFVVGLLTESRARRGSAYDVRWGVVANVVGGVVALYPLGILGMMALGDLSVSEAGAAAGVFVPGDLVKAVLAALVAAGVHRGYPGLLDGPTPSPDREASPV
jgi:biotin transport system substrate-specific component